MVNRKIQNSCLVIESNFHKSSMLNVSKKKYNKYLLIMIIKKI